MDVLRQLERESLRRKEEKERHNLERVAAAARRYKEVCDALNETYLKDAESALARLFEALDVLDGETPDGAG